MVRLCRDRIRVELSVDRVCGWLAESNFWLAGLSSFLWLARCLSLSRLFTSPPPSFLFTPCPSFHLHLLPSSSSPSLILTPPLPPPPSRYSSAVSSKYFILLCLITAPATRYFFIPSISAAPPSPDLAATRRIPLSRYLDLIPAAYERLQWRAFRSQL